MRKVLSKKAITPKKERNIEKVTPNVNLLGKDLQPDIEDKQIRERLRSPIKELVRAKLASQKAKRRKK